MLSLEASLARRLSHSPCHLHPAMPPAQLHLQSAAEAGAVGGTGAAGESVWGGGAGLFLDATAGSFAFSCEPQGQHHPSKRYQRLPFSKDFGHTPNNLKSTSVQRCSPHPPPCSLLLSLTPHHPAWSSASFPQHLSTHQPSCSSRVWEGRGRSSHETPTIHKDSIYVAMKYKCIVTNMSEIEAK